MKLVIVTKRFFNVKECNVFWCLFQGVCMCVPE